MKKILKLDNMVSYFVSINFMKIFKKFCFKNKNLISIAHCCNVMWVI